RRGRDCRIPGRDRRRSPRLSDAFKRIAFYVSPRVSLQRPARRGGGAVAGSAGSRADHRARPRAAGAGRSQGAGVPRPAQGPTRRWRRGWTGRWAGGCPDGRLLVRLSSYRSVGRAPSLRTHRGLTMPRIYIETYGCQMNVSDSELMLGVLSREGYVRTDDPADADVMLVNTCAVRDHAERRVLGRMGELKRHKRPGDVLGVVGCMAQRLGPSLLERVPQV